MNVPDDLKYTKEHEWVKISDNIATVGITDFAQNELGEIVFVEIETEGEVLNKDETFGTIEAVKTVSDLFLPLSGKIIEVNNEIQNTPEIVNEDPYNKGWMIKIKIENENEISDLIDSQKYKNLIS